MQELTFVGLSEDGGRLILALGDGRRFCLALDERVRAATRGAVRPGQMAMPTENLRPRDVQARLRAGATAEEVAEQAGWPIGRIEAFAVPVLQERSYVAQRARGSLIRFADGELELEDVVAHRLAERGIDTAEFRWDAWRSEDGRWNILLAYPAGRGDQVATWTFDFESRTLHPLDDEARWLSEYKEEPAAPSVSVPAEPDEPGAQIVNLPQAKDRPGDAEASRHPALRRQSDPPRPSAGTTPAVEAAAEQSPVAAQNPRPKRATVPSWDEILFGGSADQEGPAS